MTVSYRYCSEGQALILDAISRHEPAGPIKAIDIAAQLGLTKRGMGGRMLALERHGLVKQIILKRASPGGDAVTAWKLTAAGRKAIGR